MKIISKYKDYYDYLAGINGIDEKIVLDRTEFTTPRLRTEDEKVIVCIAGIEVHGFYNKRDDKVYYGEDLLLFADDPKRGSKWRFPWSSNHEKYYYIKMEKSVPSWRSPYVPFLKKPTPSKINEKMNCPIVANTSSWIGGTTRIDDEHYGKFPILRDFNIASVFPPETIWNMLYNYLARTKDIPNSQTDKEKIVSHGFDLKHSFRNTK
jgi:hypothetical protein